MNTETSGVRFAAHLLTVAVTVLVAGAWALLILGESGSLPGDRHGYLLHADVPTSALLSPGARVTVAGADVGRVAKVAVDDSGQGAQLELRLTDKRVTPIPRDSRVMIRTRSQVGENYVEIAIGRSPQTLPSGAWAAPDKADGQVAVDQVLSVLDGPTKQHARAFVQGLGGAVAGEGDQLNTTLRQTAATVDAGSAFTGVLYRDRAETAGLVDKLGRVGAAVGDRGQAIDSIAHRGLQALTAVGAQDDALSRMLRELPATLDQVRRTTGTLGAVSLRATPVLDGLADATARLRPAVLDLAPAGRQGRAVLQALGGAAPPLQGALSALTDAAKPVASALPGLRTTLCQANPMLRYLTPYTADLFPVLVGLGSGSNSYDATGHLIRLAAIVNENSLSGAPADVNAAVTTLADSGLVTKSKLINYDPYGKPGQSGITKATSSEPSGPDSLRASGYVYPHITADC